MDRIMIIGGPGSGKSTLARKLGAAMDLPVVHMDPIFWTPHWVLRDKGEVMEMARAAADQPRWVFDGNHSASMTYRAERAEMIVFLDMPRRLRMWRVLYRSARYFGRTRPDMATDCPERFDGEFLKFCWNYDNQGRLHTLGFLRGLEGRCIVRTLRSKSEVRGFLRDMSAQRGLA